MSREEQIVPLIDVESGSTPHVRSALGAARDDVPSAEHVEALLARMPLGGPGAGGMGGKGGAGSAGAGALAKVGAVAVLAVTASAAYIGLRAHKRPLPAHAPVPSALKAAPVAPTPDRSASKPVATAPIPPISRAARPVGPAASGSAAAPRARSEVEILREAEAALGSHPSRTLALVAEDARLHPNGVLVQEREMLRIEATLALGRHAAADALVKQFRARYPGSAYTQRLNDLTASP